MPKPIDVLGMGPTRTVTQTPAGNYLITVTPPEWTGIKKGKSIRLSRDQYERFVLWMGTQKLIQDVFPELTSEQREILLNGT